MLFVGIVAWMQRSEIRVNIRHSKVARMECNGIRGMACVMISRISLRCIRATLASSSV